MSREALVAQTLVDLADTLVDDFDVVDLLTLLADRSVEVFDVAAAGVMLISAAGDLRVVASSSDKMHVLELFEEQSKEGPCPDCYRAGAPIDAILAESLDRWPEFAPQAMAAGFLSVHALPMHVRGLTIGALNLFRSEAGQLGEEDVHTAQAFADVASIAVIQQGGTSDRACHPTERATRAQRPRRDRAGQGRAFRAPFDRDGRCLRTVARLRPQPRARTRRDGAGNHRRNLVDRIARRRLTAPDGSNR